MHLAISPVLALPATPMFRRRTSAAAVRPLSDGELRTLLIEDRERGWRVFIDQYTPTLLALIERAGIRDRDEAMELYTLACERLAADDCARLRRHDPAKGALGAWLSVLVRNVTVDWVRSRAGRRRLFKSIKDLSKLDQRVFELFYWDHHTTAEIAGRLGDAFGSPSVADVLDSLERVQRALTERQRIDLVAMAARRSAPVSLDTSDDPDDAPIDTADTAVDTERDVQARQVDTVLDAALGDLPAEDAAIVRLKFAEGLSLKQIRDMLHLTELTDQRVSGILAELKARIADRQLRASDVQASGLAFLEGGQL